VGVCYCTGVVSSSDPVEAVDKIDRWSRRGASHILQLRAKRKRQGEGDNQDWISHRPRREGGRSRKRPTTRKGRYQDEEDEEEEERREWRQFEQQRRSNFLSLDMKKIMSE
jgi:hypothetical protein